MNGNAYAYPVKDPDQHSDFLGLTKRELFAAMAVPGIAAAEPAADSDRIARWSVEVADALIVSLSK